MRAYLLLLVTACSGPNQSPDRSAEGGLDAIAMKDVVYDSTDNTCDAGGCGPNAFVIRKLFLGESDRSFVVSPTAWKEFGLDIDQKNTSAQSTDVCKLQAGAPTTVQVDGNNGIDNSFGRNIIPIFQSATSQADLSKPASDLLEQGTAPSHAIRIDGLSTAQDMPNLPPASLYKAFGPAPPTWMGNDPWAVSSRSVMGSIDKPIVTFAKGALAARVYTSERIAKATLEIVMGGLGMTLPLRQVVVRAKIGPDNKTATEGIISGVIATDDMIAAMRQTFGQIDMSLCSGVTFDGIAQQIKQSSDILQDGTQDPQKTCDAISIGLGFEAVRGTLTTVVSDSPPPMPCN